MPQLLIGEFFMVLFPSREVLLLLLADSESKGGCCVHVQLLSRIRLFATQWTVARQAPLSVEFPRQEYGSGLPIPPQGIFQTQGLNP